MMKFLWTSCLLFVTTEASVPWTTTTTTTMTRMIPRGGSSDSYISQLEGVKSAVLEKASVSVRSKTRDSRLNYGVH